MADTVKKKRRHLIKPSRLVFLIVLLAGNTFAWFIYATKINTDVTVHVRAWNIVFQEGENELSNDVSINVGDIYPGMDDYEYSLTAYNHSEVSASFTYQILSARILEDEYISIEQKQSLGLTIENDDMTSAEIEDMLSDDFPFSISLGVTGSTLNLGNGQQTFLLVVTWPYENNNDVEDTAWGIAAHEFKEDNPTLPSIALTVRLTIVQNQASPSSSAPSSSAPSSAPESP